MLLNGFRERFFFFLRRGWHVLVSRALGSFCLEGTQSVEVGRSVPSIFISFHPFMSFNDLSSHFVVLHQISSFSMGYHHLHYFASFVSSFQYFHSFHVLCQRPHDFQSLCIIICQFCIMCDCCNFWTVFMCFHHS